MFIYMQMCLQWRALQTFMAHITSTFLCCSSTRFSITFAVVLLIYDVWRSVFSIALSKIHELYMPTLFIHTIVWHYMHFTFALWLQALQTHTHTHTDIRRRASKLHSKCCRKFNGVGSRKGRAEKKKK